MSATLRRALAYAAPERRHLALAVALQVATVGAGIGLMGTSAWLISRAALHPSIAALSVAIVGVRFFGLVRGLLRYIERVVSHDATLGVLARLREQVYRALEPLAPARLMERKSGDLLVRLVDDVETLEHVYVRILGPSLSAVFVARVADTPNPIPTPYPSPTPFDLAGLFCEYQFCMGHSIDMAFYAVSAVNSNQGSPSTYSQGLIAAFNGNLFIQMIWQLAPGTADPQFMLDLILDETVDTRVGTLDVKLVRDMNVIFSPITSTATPLLPYGGAAAWTCGERAFAWKVYSPQAESAQPLFDEALSRFTCKK